MAVKDLHITLWDREYETPSFGKLLELLLKDRHPTGPVNQVWPGVYIGDASTARDITTLGSLGITHIVNAADGPHRIDTGASYYADAAIDYHGVAAADRRDFDLTPFFYPATEFMQAALSRKGKVLVHCARGISRSATLVLAFLMIHEKLTLTDAVEAVRRHRNVLPNAGFLNQLRQLDITLTLDRKSKRDAGEL